MDKIFLSGRFCKLKRLRQIIHQYAYKSETVGSYIAIAVMLDVIPLLMFIHWLIIGY